MSCKEIAGIGIAGNNEGLKSYAYNEILRNKTNK